MSVADICVLASVLVVVLIVAKMLRAIRLLDGRVSILQEQLKLGRATASGSGTHPPALPKPPSGKTPVLGVPIMPPPAAAPRTPPPSTVEETAREASPFPGEVSAHYIDEAEAEAVWARMEAEEARLKKAMGRDFQVRAAQLRIDPARSAAAIRGRPTDGPNRPSASRASPSPERGSPSPSRASSTDNRAKPAARALTAQELAKKLERR